MPYCSGHKSFRRRGIAMLLVIISMMMATIMTTAYLASRDNSGAMGQNVTAAAEARWAAASGLDAGVALLQSNAAWRTAHVGGQVVNDMALAGGTVDLDLLDLDTDAPPTASTDRVRLTATATVNGIVQVATVEADVSPETPDTVDIDLSEFAVFATDLLDMEDDSIIARWATAPASGRKRRIAIGTLAMNPNDISLADDATIIDAVLYTPPGASNSLVDCDNATVVSEVAMLDPIAAPAAPSCGAAEPSGFVAPVWLIASNATINANTRVGATTLMNGATQTLQGNITVVCDGTYGLLLNSKLVIDGNVKLVLFDDLVMSTSAIELRPGATLSLYIRDSVSLIDSYIGRERAADIRDNSGSAAHMDPQRVEIFSMPTGGANPSWLLRNNTVVQASIYGPTTDLEIRNQSALYGRVAGRRIHLEDDGAIFYDHSLDRKVGYTRATSKLYDGSQRILPAFQALVKLDDTNIQAAADATSTKVLSPRKRGTALICNTCTDAAAVVVAPTEPTPRPFDVEYQVSSLGIDALLYEAMVTSP